MDALDKTEKSCSDKVQKAVKETKVKTKQNFNLTLNSFNI